MSIAVIFKIWKEFHSMKLKNNTYIIKDVNGHKIGTMKTSSEQTYEEDI